MIKYEAGYFVCSDKQRYRSREDAVYNQTKACFKRVKELAKCINGVFAIRIDASEEIAKIVQFLHRGRVPADLTYLCYNQYGEIISVAEVFRLLEHDLKACRGDAKYYQDSLNKINILIAEKEKYLNEFKTSAK